MEEELLKKIQALIADSQKENIKKADLDKTIATLNAEIAKLSKPEIDSLPETVNKLIAEQAKLTASVNAMTEVANKTEADKPVTFKQALMDAITESAKAVPSLVKEVTNEEGIKKQSMKDYFLKLGNKNTPELTVKVAVDMLESNIVGNYVDTLRLTALDPNRVSIPLTIYPHVTEWMPVKGMTTKSMALLVVGTYVDGSQTKTEGSASGQSSFLLTTVSFPSFVIATYGTLSDETLEDLPEAMDEISRTFPSKILDNVDSQILGTSGNDSSALAGLLTANKFTAFASATTYATSTKNANMVDVVAKMKLQSKKNKHVPDVCVLNASDIEKLTAEKDQLDNSKFDRRIAYNSIGEPVAICGLALIQSEAVTADQVVVLARNMLQIGDRRSMTMEIGYDGNNFKEGKKTVRISVRLAFGVRDKAAVIYCSGWDAAVNAITVV
jgi:hypothetical protein